ncbi:MAG: PEGA domain-containing protein [Planctomycetes bacterium]|nr:PEGA domain-containing protein [Planctomycetota bacterium]
MLLRTLVLALAAVCFASCHIVQRPGVALSTSPPGARITVDGRDSGFLTPCVLDIDRDDHTLDFELDGYQTASREVTSGGGVYVVLWREAYLNAKVWRFPLWLNYIDFFGPVKVDLGNSPGRIFVRLRRASQG